VELFWSIASHFLPEGFRTWAVDGRLCRLHLTISNGILEPFCAFAGLLLCRGILRQVIDYTNQGCLM